MSEPNQPAAAGDPIPAPALAPVPQLAGDTALATVQGQPPFGAKHLAGIAGIGFAGNQLLAPLIDYGFQLAHPSVVPTEKVIGSIATILSIGVALLAVRIYRGRDAFAAYVTGGEQ